MAKIKLSADMDAAHGVFTVVLHDVRAGGVGLALAIVGGTMEAAKMLVGGTMEAAKMQRNGEAAAVVIAGSYLTAASALSAVARGIAALERGGMEVTETSLHRPGEACAQTAEPVAVLMFAAEVAKLGNREMPEDTAAVLCDHKGPRRASSGIDAGVCGDCGAFVGVRK